MNSIRRVLGGTSGSLTRSLLITSTTMGLVVVTLSEDSDHQQQAVRCVCRHIWARCCSCYR
jgi:hypothetical protein